MALSKDLEKVLHIALTGLATHPKGELILPHRKRIWTALGPRAHEGARAVLGVGLQRRTALAVQCARQVLPLWERALPGDRRPHQILALAEQYLMRRADFPAVFRTRGEFETALDNLLSGGEHLLAAYAG